MRIAAGIRNRSLLSAPLPSARRAQPIGALALALLAVVAARATVHRQPPSHRPNILLVITDDQGYGDLGVHGNSRVHTPHLDRLAREGTQFSAFHVSPVCSPTRASLLTGRYHYRTGVVDTYLGRSLMHGGEVTLAEMLKAAGYRTGIFGKWHLGDTYPLRAMDQGFEESLTLNGGGLGQPSDPPGGERYQDPLLRRNGVWVRRPGYVSDAIAEGALDFIRESRSRPFFAYVAFNAPHTPLEVPPGSLPKYAAMNLTAADGPVVGHPVAANFSADTTARVYAMVENVDANVGRLLSALDELSLSEQTIVVFLTDNGPQQPRYNAGLKGLKGTVHDGGIRVPLFVRWPGRLAGNRTIDRIAAHIDVVPTLLDLAGVAAPRSVQFDGRSLLPLLLEEARPWPDRTLFFQWHRGDVPERGRAFAARSQRYKLVQALGNGDKPPPPGTSSQLFDMTAHPFEMRDIAGEQPQVAARLQEEYDTWFTEVTRSRAYSDAGIARIHVGAPQENPVRLTRQDWRGPAAGWTPASVGHWQIDVRRDGRYSLAVRVVPSAKAGRVEVTVGATHVEQPVPAGAATVTVERIRLARGPTTLGVRVSADGESRGALDVVITRH